MTSVMSRSDDAAPRLVLLANIGHRDLAFDGKPLLHPLRGSARALLDAWDESHGRLALPILDPLMKLVRRRHPGTPVAIVLFASDQKDPEHRKDDTLHAAECAARLLRERKGVAAVEVEAVHEPPHRHDAMFALYRERLVALKDQGPVERVYAAGAGGTPACNMALLFHAIRVFGTACVPAYTVEGRDEAETLELGGQVNLEFVREQARAAVERADYGAAAPLFRALGCSAAAYLCESAHERLSFNFEAAREIIDRHRAGMTDAAAEAADRFRRTLDPSRDEESAGLLNELYHNMRIIWRRGQYLDFAGRLFRLIEGVLKYTAAKHLPGLDVADLKGTVPRIAGLRNYLDERSKWKEIERRNARANTPVLLAILSFAVERAPVARRPALKATHELCKKIHEEHGRRRHESPLGHGFQGITRSDLVGRGETDFAFDRIKAMLEMVDVRLADPFTPLDAFLREAARP